MAEARVSMVVRTNIFTQQTNILEVDKHSMCESQYFFIQFIILNLLPRTKDFNDEGIQDKASCGFASWEVLYNIADLWKVEKQKTAVDIGSTMLE